MDELDNLLAKISDMFDVSPEDVTGKGRETRLIDVRHIVCVVAFDRGYNYSEIARFINIHHSSVQYYVKERPRYDNVNKVIEQLINTDKLIQETARRLIDKPDDEYLQSQMMRLIVQ